MTSSDPAGRYEHRWVASGAAYQDALRWLPGGNTRTQVFVAPFPVYARSAFGATVTLDDGTTVDDFLLNYTAAALGHSHPAVTEAVLRAVGNGGPPGLPTASEITLAHAVCDRFPAIERVRFANSGSEATLQAIRVAKAHTGRDLIAMAEGGYHGTHGVDEGGPTFPFNDLVGARASLTPTAGEIAAVIIEPFLNSGGAIPAEPSFLAGIEAWCLEHAVLLIVDEVASWRTSYRGAAARYSIEPDILCLGKGLGGGFPFGAVGGRYDVMEHFDPRGAHPVRHAGTFNAHPVSMAAGVVVLDVLDEPTIDRMNAQTADLAGAVARIGAELDLPLTATHSGSIGRMHVARTPPTSGREAAALPKAPLLQLHRALLEGGIMIGHEGRFSVCTETTDEQCDRLLTAVQELASSILGTRERMTP